MDKTKLKTLLISSDTTLKESMQRLNDTAQQILFVTDKDDKLMGTVTDGDIRRGLLNGLKFSDEIEKIMYKKFISLSIDVPDLEKQAKKIMINNKIEQIPILNEIGEVIDVILWTELFGSINVNQKVKYSNLVIVMAGGKGTRLDPFTKILPKPLIPIGNKPVIEHIMDRFSQSGFCKFTYTLHYKKEYIKLFLRENKFSYAIDWVEEDDFCGTAGGLSLLKDKITDTFFVTNCDTLLNVNYEDILKWHKEHEASITIIGCHNEVQIPFGVLELSNGKLGSLLEKPTHDVIINTGVYVMEPRVISYISEGKHIDMNELINLVAEKEKITVYPISHGWFDVGQWEKYRENQNIIENKNIRK